MTAVEVFSEWLDSYLNFEKNPQKNILWLDTIDYICKLFDNPQDSAPCVHVAGSKGKGSVSTLIASILTEAGFSVGLYTSPHISDLRERITQNGEFLSEEIYEKAIKELVPKIESIIPENLPGDRPITWFELVTTYAFLCFRQARTDWNVFEVGLGGRLDSTNIVRPKLCCLTPIEKEHTEFLGNTIEEIAMEKAGIIKNCTPVIISRQNYEQAKTVFCEKAIAKHAPYYFVDELIKNLNYSFDSETKRMDVSFESEMFTRPIRASMRMLGSLQLENAAMAAVGARKLLPNLSEEIIERGISRAYLPGRFEIIEGPSGLEGLTVILDGAHTQNSIRLTVDTLNKLYDSAPANLLFACAADKDVKDIALDFKHRFNRVFITRPGCVKKSDLEAEKAAFSAAKIAFTADPDYKTMIRTAFEQSQRDGGILLVTGSFYLLAEVKKFLCEPSL